MSCAARTDAQRVGLWRTDAHAGLRAARQVGERRLHHEAPASDDHDVVDGLRDLGQQVARHDHRPAAVGERTEEAAQPVHALGVEAVGGLVEDQHLRVAEQGARQAEPLAHAEREALDAPVADVAEPDQLQHLVDARLRDLASAASTRRWLRARRPGWKELDSRTAPT